MSVPLRNTTTEGFGWILYRKEGKKRIAHVAMAGPCGTKFVPLFPTKRDALEYRDERLGMPNMVAKRAKVTP